MITALLAIVAVLLSIAVGYEAYMRRQDLRIYRSLLAEESAERIRLIRQLQHNESAAEEAIANTQCALMWTAWRLAEAGVLGPDDAPGDVETIN